MGGDSFFNVFFVIYMIQFRKIRRVPLLIPTLTFFFACCDRMAGLFFVLVAVDFWWVKNKPVPPLNVEVSASISFGISYLRTIKSALGFPLRNS